MSAVTFSNLSAALKPTSQFSYSSRGFFLNSSVTSSFRRIFAATIRTSSSTAIVENKPVLGFRRSSGGQQSHLLVKRKQFFGNLMVKIRKNVLVCPICYDTFIWNGDPVLSLNLILIRADISRLPIASSSLDAVHAGAALHCWPSPSAGVAEISRVLRPGGVFVATTYILDGPYSFIPLLAPLRQNIGQISGSHIFLSDRELEDLCTSCGLVDFTCVRNRRFVMISARKPT